MEETKGEAILNHPIIEALEDLLGPMPEDMRERLLAGKPPVDGGDIDCGDPDCPIHGRGDLGDLKGALELRGPDIIKMLNVLKDAKERAIKERDERKSSQGDPDRFDDDLPQFEKDNPQFMARKAELEAELKRRGMLDGVTPESDADTSKARWDEYRRKLNESGKGPELSQDEFDAKMEADRQLGKNIKENRPRYKRSLERAKKFGYSIGKNEAVSEGLLHALKDLAMIGMSSKGVKDVMGQPLGRVWVDIVNDIDHAIILTQRRNKAFRDW